MLRVRADGTIFISIASYRDNLLEFTLKQAYAMATNKKNLVFGVVEQATEEEALKLDSLKFKDQIRYIRVNPEYSRGCCWARSLVQSLYQGEDYFLQIDSHTAFEADWDKTLILRLKYLLQHHKKPVITNYPNGLEFDAEGNAIKIQPKNTPLFMPILLAPPLEEPTFANKDSAFIISRSTGVDTIQDYVFGFFLSAGGLFTIGKVVEDVPYDPYLMFGGEEPSLALRLFTNGYTIFHIRKMPLFHLYTDHEKRTRKLFWDKSENENRSGFTSSQIQIKSDKRLPLILTDKLSGVYGLGKVRTLEDYKIFSGIDYLNRSYKPSDIWRMDHKTDVDRLLKRERGKL